MSCGRKNLEPSIQAKTGLLLSTFLQPSCRGFSTDVEGARQKADRGELAFGTVDCFLLWRLTSGQSHATDATNASRTSLYNIHTGIWDKELLDIFQIPESMLPEVLDCEALFGETDNAIFGRSIPVTEIAGDQQAASIGQCCFEHGDIKSTYGTGCFVLVNSGDTALASKNRMLTTVAYQIDGKTTYALEGSFYGRSRRAVVARWSRHH
ncbi:MAG: FGGY family carbohydrate kinase [Porticoccaceae bacterium]